MHRKAWWVVRMPAEGDTQNNTQHPVRYVCMQVLQKTQPNTFVLYVTVMSQEIKSILTFAQWLLSEKFRLFQL